MKIHREGHRIIRNQIIIYLLTGLITQYNDIFVYYITPIFCIIFLFSLFFFRVPKRIFKRKKNIIYSPCDGKIVVIEKVIENEYFKKKRKQVSIFMSPLNIHNNLYPISGEIIYKKYNPGKFLFAWNPKASIDNESSSIVIKNKNISIMIKQIAGALARRIITYAKPGDSVNVADELGFIKFGSRVDLFLPEDTNINVNIGEKVKGGETILATY